MPVNATYNKSLTIYSENNAAATNESIDVSALGDIDVFNFQLNSGNTYQFGLEGADSGSGTLSNPWLFLADLNNNIITSDDDSGVGYDALISYAAASTATYALWATSLLGTGTYALTVTVSDFAAGTSTVGQIAIVGYSAPTGNSIATTGDHDWFSMSLVAGSKYNFELNGADTSDGTLGDPELSLRNASGTVITTDNDTGTGRNAMITYTATSSGTYYLDAHEYGDNATGGYKLTATEIINHAPTGNVAINIPGQTLTLNITGNVTINLTASQGQTLTATNTLADADGLGAINYQWLSNSTAITGANQSTYALTQSDVGKTISVIASYTDGFGTAETKISNVNIAVANVNDLPTGSVTINGTASQGQTLSAANTLTDADGMGAITYQWMANGSNIGTGSTYILTNAEVGKTITVTASYTDGFGTAETSTGSATSAVANVNDLPTGSVTISGTASQGQTLGITSTLADGDGLGVISYQWKADGISIGTGSTYALTQAEVGKTISVTASYTDGFGVAETKTSDATAAVLNSNDLPTGGVTLSGTATQGQILSAANTLADADGVGVISYQWKADGANIGTGSTYALTQAEVGKTISVTASYTDGFGAPETSSGSATSAVTNLNDLPTGDVTINGTALQGQTLTASNTLADADGMGTVSYQWMADGGNIGTGNPYTLTQAEVGKAISVTASYTDGFGTVETKAGHATGTVANLNDLPTGSVTISGTATQNQTLTAANTLVDADGMGAITYQWKAGSANIGTGNTYKLTAADVGKTISVTAGYIDGRGTAESFSSGITSAVTPTATTAGFAITPGGTDTGEDGSSVSYRIALNTAPLPNQNVVITFTSSDAGEGVIAQPTLTFAASNYATPQTLTVRGVDDYLDDGNVPYQITAKVSTTDVFYKTLTISPFSLTNTDDGLDTALDLYGDEGGSKVDVLVGGNGADKLHGVNMADNLSGGIGNDTLYGGYGDDNLFGEAGDDKLQGEQESDYMEGGAGNDTLDGGDGADSMIGGAGNDVYYLGYDATDVIADQGLPGDVDTVIMPYQLTRYTLPVGIENGTIAEGTQANSLTGNSGSNTLTGNAGNNGLNGGVGRDALFGDLGRDVLSGGVGGDTLTGGAGADRFDFNTPSETSNTSRDVINDFKLGEGDKIDLAGIDANTAGTGDQAFTFIGSSAFNGAGQVRFDAVAHVLYGSNDTDSAAEFAIQLNGVAGLTATAFIL